MPFGSCLADSMEAAGLRIRKRPGRVTAWQVATTNTLLNSTSRSHTQRRYGDRRCRIGHPSSGEEYLARRCRFSGPTCCSNLSGQAARILGMIHEGWRWRKAPTTLGGPHIPNVNERRLWEDSLWVTVQLSPCSISRPHNGAVPMRGAVILTGQ